MTQNGNRSFLSLNGKPTKLLFYAIKLKSFPFSVFRFPFFANFAKGKANGQ